MYLLLVLGATLSFVFGAVCMKLSAGLSQIVPTIMVYLFFVSGVSLETLAMRDGQLGTTYLFVAGLEAVLAFVFGITMFQEHQSTIKLVGLSLIVAGLVFLNGDG